MPTPDDFLGTSASVNVDASGIPNAADGGTNPAEDEAARQSQQSYQDTRTRQAEQDYWQRVNDQAADRARVQASSAAEADLNDIYSGYRTGNYDEFTRAQNRGFSGSFQEYNVGGVYYNNPVEADAYSAVNPNGRGYYASLEDQFQTYVADTGTGRFQGSFPQYRQTRAAADLSEDIEPIEDAAIAGAAGSSLGGRNLQGAIYGYAGIQAVQGIAQANRGLIEGRAQAPGEGLEGGVSSALVGVATVAGGVLGGLPGAAIAGGAASVLKGAADDFFQGRYADPERAGQLAGAPGGGDSVQRLTEAIEENTRNTKDLSGVITTVSQGGTVTPGFTQLYGANEDRLGTAAPSIFTGAVSALASNPLLAPNLNSLLGGSSARTEDSAVAALAAGDYAGYAALASIAGQTPDQSEQNRRLRQSLLEGTAQIDYTGATAGVAQGASGVLSAGGADASAIVGANQSAIGADQAAGVAVQTQIASLTRALSGVSDPTARRAIQTQIAGLQSQSQGFETDAAARSLADIVLPEQQAAANVDIGFGSLGVGVQQATDFGSPLDAYTASLTLADAQSQELGRITPFADDASLPVAVRQYYQRRRNAVQGSRNDTLISGFDTYTQNQSAIYTQGASGDAAFGEAEVLTGGSSAYSAGVFTTVSADYSTDADFLSTQRGDPLIRNNPLARQRLTNQINADRLREVGAEDQEAQYQAPYDLLTRFTRDEGTLTRLGTSFAQPGSVNDARLAVGRDFEEQSAGLERYVSDARKAGTLTPRQEYQFAQQEEAIKTQEAQSFASADFSYFSRLPSLDIGGASSAFFERLPSQAQAAGYTERSGAGTTAARNFGFYDADTGRTLFDQDAAHSLTTGKTSASVAPGNFSLADLTAAVRDGVLAGMNGSTLNTKSQGSALPPNRGTITPAATRGGNPALPGSSGFYTPPPGTGG